MRVITPQRSNHVVADVVARSYFTDLLRGGVRIFLYRDAMVHAKTATVDGAWTTVGTANIDRLSLRGNYEVNLEILDRDPGAGDGGHLPSRPRELRGAVAGGLARAGT